MDMGCAQVFKLLICNVSTCSYRYRLANAAGVGFDMVGVAVSSFNGSVTLTTRVTFPVLTVLNEVELFVDALQQNLSNILYGSSLFREFDNIILQNLSFDFVDPPLGIHLPTYAPSPSLAPTFPPVTNPQFKNTTTVCRFLHTHNLDCSIVNLKVYTCIRYLQISMFL